MYLRRLRGGFPKEDQEATRRLGIYANAKDPLEKT
jgi:hypothetical protein